MAQDTLSTRYDPQSVEDRIYKFWLDGRFFHAEPDDRDPFTIVIPPPNVTAVLHIGHALNNVIQDILIRFNRMNGKNALWVPGTDHAGIATQNVVERKLHAEGTDRHELGREKFLDRVWEWREEYGSSIINQLKRLGASCDWERERFTMDEGLSRAVREAFVTFYNDGLIYRGEYMVNWCPRCQTALSDDEVEHEEHESYLWHLRYPFKDDPRLHVEVATTRPETMLGDTAVAVHPDDERFKDFIGDTLLLPIVNREIPIIADERVDPSFGTGAVKVTPSHDPNDFLMGRDHDLEFVCVINEDGTMNDNAGDYAGQDRYECREALIEELKEKQILSHSDPHVHNVGHCYRCHCVIEPYVSMQWFVKMKPLAEKALEASDDKRVQFVPQRWEKVYRSWLENVRDWCISRQIWWGHRIPAWICSACGEATVERDDPTKCAHCGSDDIEQDSDVLDTWFSSALWPFSTLGWPDQTPELDYYYPTDVLVTDRGIIYLWVARMVMDGLRMMKKEPFHHVFIHATIQDELGRKMSKSLGNGIDPIEVIEKYGADALRYSLMMLTVEQQDVRLAEKKFEIGRNFANKVWNASRFVMMNLGDAASISALPWDAENAALEDRWIMSRLGKTLRHVTDALENYRFNEAANAIYDFTWREFCDWYVEIVKPRLDAADDDGARARGVLIHVLDGIMRMLHPFTPFLTEEIWQRLRDYVPASCMRYEEGDPAEAIIVSAWPTGADHPEYDEDETSMVLLQGIIRSAREVRSRMNIPDAKPIRLVVATEAEEDALRLKAYAQMLNTLAGVETLEAGVGLEKPAGSAADVVEGMQVYIPLKGLIDLEEERERLRKRIEEAEKYLIGSDKKLANDNFVSRAPEDVVHGERERNREARERLRMLQENLADLADS